MMTLLEMNLNALRARLPDQAETIGEAFIPAGASVQMSQSGAPTLVLNKVSLHSRFDPWAEARRMIQNENFPGMPGRGSRAVVFGHGLGYHVLLLAERVQNVLVVEPEPGLVKLSFTHLDFRRMMPGLAFLLGQDAVRRQPLGRKWMTAPLVVHAPSARIHRRALDDLVGNKASTPAKNPAFCDTETVAFLRQAWAGLPGARELLSGLSPDSPIGLTELGQLVQGRRGDLSETEIYIMLIDEFSRAEAQWTSERR